jgi:hypothetical protein
MPHILDQLWALWKCEESGGTRADFTGRARNLEIDHPCIGGNIPSAPSIIGDGALFYDMDAGGIALFLAHECPNLGAPFSFGYWLKFDRVGTPQNFNTQIEIDDPLFSSTGIILLSEVDGDNPTKLNLVFLNIDGIPEAIQVEAIEGHEYLIVVSMDPVAKTLQCYVDNILVGDFADVSLRLPSTLIPQVYVGAWDYLQNTVKQVVDEIFIYTRALSVSEIETIWNHSNGTDLGTLISAGGSFDNEGNWIPSNPGGPVIFSPGMYSAEDLTGMPVLNMRYSKDGGYTFGPEKPRGAGKIGQYLYRCRWPGNLGRARAPFIEISGQSKQRIVIVDSYADIDEGLY